MSVLSQLGQVNWGNLMNQLTSAGIDPTSALSAVKALATNSHLKTTLSALVQQMVINENNAAALSALAVQIETTPGASVEINALANAAVASAGQPVAFMQAIGQLEGVINAL